MRLLRKGGGTLRAHINLDGVGAHVDDGTVGSDRSSQANLNGGTGHDGLPYELRANAPVGVGKKT